MLKTGFKIKNSTPNALTQSCYYELNEKIIKELLKHIPMSSETINLTINQGNARALSILLEETPKTFTKKVIQELIELSFQSSCYGCMKGGKKCQRCLHDPNFPFHPKTSSFEKTIDVLLSTGFKVNNNLLSKCQKLAYECSTEPIFQHLKSKTLKHCCICGKKDGLKLCSSCNEAYYCSRECQSKGWKFHKQICNK